MTTTQFMTAVDLEQMPSDARYELYQGVLQEMSPSSAQSSVVLSTIGYELSHFVRTHHLGIVLFAEAGFRLERDPDTVVAPDIAFIRSDRIPDPIPNRGYFELTPDFVIEVISPTDEPGNSRRKQALYERVGVPLVWWIDPARRTAAVYRHGRSVVQLTAIDTLDGADIVPEFTIALTEILDI